MRINDESILKEMRKSLDKKERINSYKVKYMLHNGTYEELTFNQGYDASNDVYNSFFIRVYNSNNSYIVSGSGPTIEDSYNNLISSLILYLTNARQERDDSNKKLNLIYGIINPENEEDNDLF